MDGRWLRLNELFDQLADAGPDTRRETLASLDDDPLARKLSAMLRAHDADADRPQGVVDRALEALKDAEPAAGDRVGPYSLLHAVGHGGMGTVYLAERADDAYASRVAVKVIRSMAARPDTLRRFRAERQILADLNHPGIARLLDGGETEDGTPFLVMEYVDGVPIDQYCQERYTSLEERLRLFRKVCDAVQFAHTRLIVHRDLKPANVLVGEDGEPRLLDFGIAKILGEADAGADPGLTRTGLRPMTPRYASPEQVRGEAVSTASDVYALGVLLYVVLTGQLPYRETKTPRELEDAILHEDPKPPSHAVAQATTTSSGVSTTGRRSRRLGADVDTIVLKALNKDPERRYETVEQLADDLRRYLEGLPVRARPDTVTYRAGKFVRRNLGAVLGGTATAISIVLFGVASGIQAYQLERERDAAEVARAEAEAVTDFLVQVFDATNPDVAQGLDLTARDILGNGRRRVRTELADQPLVQSSVMGAIGEAYERLGAYDSAHVMFTEGTELAREHAGPSSAAHMRRLLDLGGTWSDLGEVDQAEATFRQALDIGREVHGPESPEVATALNNLGGVLVDQSMLDEAVDTYLEALRIRSAQLGEDHPMTLSTLSNLGITYSDLSRYDEAIEVLVQATEGRRRLAGVEPTLDLARSLNNLASAYEFSGRYDDAEPLYLESLEIRQTLLDDGHPLILTLQNNLAGFYLRTGGAAEALALFDEVIAARSQREDQPMRLATLLSNRAVALVRLDRHAEALEPLRQSEAMIRETMGPEHPIASYPLQSRGDVYKALDRLEEAEAAYREAIRLRRNGLGADDPQVAFTLTKLGRFLLDEARVTEAEAVLTEAWEIRQSALDADHPHRIDSDIALAQLRLAQGETGEARDLLQQAERAAVEARGEDDREARDARRLLDAMAADGS